MRKVSLYIIINATSRRNSIYSTSSLCACICSGVRRVIQRQNIKNNNNNNNNSNNNNDNNNNNNNDDDDDDDNNNKILIFSYGEKRQGSQLRTFKNPLVKMQKKPVKT